MNDRFTLPPDPVEDIKKRRSDDPDVAVLLERIARLQQACLTQSRMLSRDDEGVRYAISRVLSGPMECGHPFVCHSEDGPDRCLWCEDLAQFRH